MSYLQNRFQVAIVGGGTSAAHAAVASLKAGLAPEKIAVVVGAGPNSRAFTSTNAIDALLQNRYHHGLLANTKGPSHALPSLEDLTWEAFVKKSGGNPNTFVDRSLTGEFTQEVFEELKQKGVSIFREQAVHYQNPGTVGLANGSSLDAEHVVVATGLPEPTEIRAARLLPKDKVSHNFLQSSDWTKLHKSPSVLVIGTALTGFIDIHLLLLALEVGDIHLVSRRGYTPLPHPKNPIKKINNGYEPATNAFSDLARNLLIKGGLEVFSDEQGLDKLTQLYDDEIQAQRSFHGEDAPQHVVGSLRNYNSDLFANLSPANRFEFLTKLASRFSRARNCAPAETFHIAQENLKTGKSKLHRGDIELRPASQGRIEVLIQNEDSFLVDHVITAAGYRGWQKTLENNSFLKSLIQSGSAQPNILVPGTQPFGLSFSGNVYGVGPINIGNLFEHSLHDQAVQAAQVARIIANGPQNREVP